MVSVGIDKVIEKLCPLMKSTLEEAAALAVSSGQYHVENEHWLLAILNQPHTDLLSICRLAGLDKDVLLSELKESVQAFRNGNTRPPSFSPSLMSAASEAWTSASMQFDHPQITSAHFLHALVSNETSFYPLSHSVKHFADLKVSALPEWVTQVVGTTTESALINEKSAIHSGTTDQNRNALAKYCVNLTERAAQHEIDPVLGRDTEIRQLIDILLRRRQNNPILTGEPGVGKTAVVEGLANRIVINDVPEPLKGVSLLSLDMGLLQAGASVKGEFEKRLKAVIQEVKESTDPIIMFIDEAHTLIGAGGAEGKGDAANLLKPALARGEFRTIAATTYAEYKKYFEKDPALTRRFQVVNVAEPSVPVAIDMMRGIAKTLEQHHGIRILDEAIEASVKLSSRYIPSRQLPDKSVSLLDTACARVSLSQGATPAVIEKASRTIEQCITNIDLLKNEQEVLGGCEKKIADYEALKSQTENELIELNAQWEQEKTIVDAVQLLREGDANIEAMQAKLAELRVVQGDNPMIYLDVDEQAVAQIVESWTGIPVGKMLSDEIDNMLKLEHTLAERVVGQDHAMQKIAEAIRISRAGLMDPRKPVGVFLMVGTSGTGKTETALALSDLLYGGEQNLVTINMSEFKEEHKVSMLLGASAGYVGYGEGGVLTEAVRRNPYSVVLLDEMEKAHPGIQDVFYNLFDKGTIKDGEGRDIDFRHTLIIMTSNAASSTLAEYFGQSEWDEKELLERIRPELLEDFRPAFLGRTTIVPYFPLSKDVLQTIIGINLRKIEKRLVERYDAEFKYADNVMEFLLEKCKDPDTGARNAENVINKTLLPAVSNACLSALAQGQEITVVNVTVNDEGEFSVSL